MPITARLVPLSDFLGTGIFPVRARLILDSFTGVERETADWNNRWIALGPRDYPVLPWTVGSRPCSA